MAKITGYLHPVTFNCWNGGENIYGHYRDFAIRMSQDDQFFLKDFLMNAVYNFGHIFDAARDVVLFFIEEPRGTENLVHDMGYNVGLIQYLVITPGLAKYRSNAVHHEKTKYSDLTPDELRTMNG